jgi:hypothetical protein
MPVVPESSDLDLARGSEALRQGQVQAALDAFHAALRTNPDNPRALALLGLAYFRSSRFADAQPVFEQLVKLVPGDASHRLNLGLVHLKLGEAELAIAELEVSRDLDPSQGRAASYLGLAYARAGRYVEAYQAFLQAGQADLAREVEEHLSPVEKAAIDTHLEERRTGRSELPPVANEPAAAVQSMADGEPSAVFKFVQPDPMSSPEIQIISGGSQAAIDVPPAAADAAPADGKAASGVVIAPASPEGAISRAVAVAAPAGAEAAAAGTKVAAGSTPPMPLSEFATSRLVRPEDGDFPFEISTTGVLVVRVTDKVFSRTEGVDVTGGQLAYEPAMRRSRGAQTTEPFDEGERPMFVVSGKGHLVAMPLGGVFTAVQLDDDILYLREDLVFAFESRLRWENGHVPGSRARIRMVQFRGSGSVAFRSKRPLIAVKLSAPGVLYIDASAIAGWIGRVVPRAVAPAGGGAGSVLFVECSGEGVVLVEEDAGHEGLPYTGHRS